MLEEPSNVVARVNRTNRHLLSLARKASEWPPFPGNPRPAQTSSGQPIPSIHANQAAKQYDSTTGDVLQTGERDTALPMQDMLRDRGCVVRPHPENIKISPGMLHAPCGCCLLPSGAGHQRLGWPVDRSAPVALRD
jgi:hypothetical protein